MSRSQQSERVGWFIHTTVPLPRLFLSLLAHVGVRCRGLSQSSSSSSTNSPANASPTCSSSIAIFRTVLGSCSCRSDFFSTPMTTASLPFTPTWTSEVEVRVQRCNVGCKASSSPSSSSSGFGVPSNAVVVSPSSPCLFSRSCCR